MPMYEYRCQECGSPFSIRRSMDERDAATACPNCAGNKVMRQLSTFAAFSHGDSGQSTSLNSSPCGGCASTGGCSSCGVKHA